MNRTATRLLLMCLLTAGGCATADRPMQLLSGSAPVYPAEAKAKGLEGWVRVRYDVSADGRVVNARVERAEPPGVFEEAALATVRSWRFNPATKDGQPVAVTNVVSTVRFQIPGESPYADY